MKKIIVGLAFSLALSGCADPVERSAEYMESGKTLYAQDKLAKAKLEFRNALQIDNKLAGAYYHLGLIDEQDKNWKGMYKNLSKTIGLDPENYDARLKLAKLYLLSGENEKALTEIDKVLSAEMNNIDAIALKGALLLKQGNYTGAMAEADKALALDAKHLDAISLKVVVYMGKGDFNTASSVIEVALVDQPNELTLHLLQLQVYVKSNNEHAIEKTYQDLITRFADKPEFSYALAKFYVSKQRDAEARSVLQSVVDNSTELTPKLVLLDYLLETDKPAAEALLAQFIKDMPDEVELYLRQANIFIAEQKFDEAKKSLTWVVEHHEKDKEGLQAKVVLAKLAAKDEDNAAALKLVNEVLAIDVRHYDALLLKARLNLIDAQYDQAITDLRGILRDYSESDEAMVLMAQAYLKKESPELAEENFRKALDVNPGNFSAVMPVVSRMVQSKDLLRADEVLNKALSINPNHAGALQALAQVRLLNKDWQGTQQVADLISTKPQGEGFSYYLSGKISQGQKNYQDAIGKYKKALAVTPSLSDALSSIAVSYQALNQQDALFAYFDEFVQKHPENFQPALLKAKVYAAKKDWTNALATLDKGLVTWPKVPQFYSVMASIYKAKNEPAKVIESYEKGLSKIPNSYQLMLLLASAYEGDKNYVKAIEVYDDLIAKKPDVDIAVNNLVALLLDYAPSAENIQRGLKLSERFIDSKQAYFVDTYGWALLKNDKLKESVDVFKKVNSMMPNVAVFQYHLGFAYFGVKNYVEAEKILKLALLSGDKQNTEFLEKTKVNALLEELKTKVPVAQAPAI